MELTAEQNMLRQSREPLADALGVAGKAKTKAVRCPYHDDKHPSASIHFDADGVWRFHCFACDWKGDVFDVIARNTNRDVADVLKEYRGEPIRPPRPPRPTSPPKLIIYPTIEKAAATVLST
jgi:CHC2 zinc finger